MKKAAGMMEEDIVERWHAEEHMGPSRSRKALREPLRIPRLAACLDPRMKGLVHVTNLERKQL